MGTKIYQWTNATRNGFLNDELDALWAAINAIDTGAEATPPTFTASSAHGFSVGDFIGIDSNGEYAKAGGGTGISAALRVISVPTSTTFTAWGPGLHAISNSESVGRHWISETVPGDTQTTRSFLEHQQVMVVLNSSYIVLFPTEMLSS